MENKMKLDSDYSIQQIVLKKMQVQAGIRIPRHILEMSSLEKQTDLMADELIYCLRTYVTAHHWTDSHSNSFIVEVPLTWIDAIRLRFAPKFLVKKYPINYRKIKSGGDVNNNYWVFPDVPPNPDKHISDFIVAYSNRQSLAPWK